MCMIDDSDGAVTMIAEGRFFRARAQHKCAECRRVIDAGEQAERERTKRLVEDMQNELQTLRDRLAKQKPRIWIYRDNPGLTTMREPGNPDLWEPLGNIV